MTPEIATVLIIILVMTISFFTELLPLGFTALMVPVLLQGTGILSASQAWSGFSNATVITWIGMFIIGSMFAKTSFTYRIKVFVKHHSGDNPVKVMILILLACTVMGLMTTAAATLAALTPIIREICDDSGLDQKRVFKSVADVSTWACVQMLPIGSSLSYFILFNQYLESAGTDLRYGLFDMTWIKLPMWFVLVAYYILASRRFSVSTKYATAAKTAGTQIMEKSITASPYTPVQEKLAIFIFTANVILMVIASFTNIVPVYLVSTTSASLAVGLRLLSEKEAFQSVSWNVIFLVAGSLPLSDAINFLRHRRMGFQYCSECFSDASKSGYPGYCILYCLYDCHSIYEQHGCLGCICSHSCQYGNQHEYGSTPCRSRCSLRGFDLLCYANGRRSRCLCLRYLQFQHERFYPARLAPRVLMTIAFVIWAPIILNFIY